MTVAVAIFFLSLSGIIALFTLKYIELRAQRVYVPRFRAAADKQARQLKALLIRTRYEASKLGPLSVLILRYFVHEAALAFASLARVGERQAHRLADMVSHKRGFERREPKNEFLKQVSEYKTESAPERPPVDAVRKNKKF